MRSGAIKCKLFVTWTSPASDPRRRHRAQTRGHVRQNITAENREQTHRIGLAVMTVLQVAGHLDTVLGHDEFVDFFSLP